MEYTAGLMSKANKDLGLISQNDCSPATMVGLSYIIGVATVVLALGSLCEKSNWLLPTNSKDPGLQSHLITSTNMSRNDKS